jgi:hypothetical protein
MKWGNARLRSDDRRRFEVVDPQIGLVVGVYGNVGSG